MSDQEKSSRVRDICFRFIAVGVRKFSTEPETRPQASALILRNALRLHMAQTSPEQTAKLALDILEGGTEARSAA